MQSITPPRLEIDGKLLAKFLFSLNIVRRHSEAYPEGHPLLVRSRRQLLAVLHRLLEYEEALPLGVARDSLLAGAHILDRKNPVYRDLAAALFACDIAALTFRRSLREEELIHFLHALRLGGEKLQEEGGIVPWLKNRGVTGLDISPIDYSAFSITEEADLRGLLGGGQEPSRMWESFVEGMMRGTLDPQGQSPFSEFPDPDGLAQWMNGLEGKSPQPPKPEWDYERAITTFLQQVDRETIDHDLRRGTLEKLAAFFGKLSPEIRRRFLSGTFRALENRRDLAEEVLGAFSGEAVLQIMDEVEEEEISIPPLVLQVLAHLTAHADPDHRDGPPKDPGLPHEDLKTRIKTLFRKDCSELFVSPYYLDLLQKLLSAPATPSLEPKNPLFQTMEGNFLEKQVCSIILQIDRNVSREDTPQLQAGLADLIDGFLSRGDLAALIETHDRLTGGMEEGEETPLSREGLALFARPEFIESIGAGIETWGRSRLPEVQALIARVGAPFAEALLVRLAGEQGMSMRRFYMDCLVRLGAEALAPVTARLRDGRWYFVRNLVIILRRLEDPGVLESLEKLVSYPHAKVQLEVMKTFHHFGDPRGDRLLLAELDHSDRERRTRAVLAARWSFTPEVFTRLIQMLQENMSEEEYPVKSALVRTLAEIGHPVTVAGLAGLLNVWSLRYRSLIKRLRAETMGALAQYPSEPGRRLLDELMRNGKGEIAGMAHEALKASGGRTA